MGHTLVTPPTAEPVTLAQVKFDCRVTSTREDSYLEELIDQATDHIETVLGRSIVTQTWKLTLDDFSDAIRLPRGPVQSVSSVQYYDATGTLQTLDSDYYTVDLTSDPQWVVLNSGYTWPSVLDAVNAVNITYVAGYATVPTAIERAIRLLVTVWYDDRKADVPEAVYNLIFNHRAAPC